MKIPKCYKGERHRWGMVMIRTPAGALRPIKGMRVCIRCHHVEDPLQRAQSTVGSLLKRWEDPPRSVKRALRIAAEMRR